MFLLYVATKEMICIMQEYGEVVFVFGSAANCLNVEIFLQADMRYKKSRFLTFNRTFEFETEI